MQLRKRLHNTLWKVGHLPFIKLFAFFFVEILSGYRIYKRLKRKYGEKTILFTCQHPGTGDVYNIGLYFHAFLKKNGIGKYTFLYRGKSEQKVGMLFGIEGDTVLSEREMLRLVRFARFIRPQNIDFVQLHHYTSPVEANASLANFEEYYKGISFTRMFKQVVMDLDSDIEAELPSFSATLDADVDFKANGLVPGKTVILAPYSNSAQVIKVSVWEDLVEKLKALGYTVATNCGSEEEYPIAGTEKLNFEYKFAKSYVELAGFFIGARSGLCDIVSSLDCKKIVLTPYWSPTLSWLGKPGKSMKFYGMWPNYGYDSTIEIEYDFDSVELLPDKIVELLSKPSNPEHEIILHQDLNPKFENKTAIVLSLDEYVAPCASVTLQSIIEFSTQNNTYDIILLNDGIDVRTKRLLMTSFVGHDNFSVRFVDSRPFCARNLYQGRREYLPITYNRFILPTLLDRFEKVIYLDTDMLMNTDIADLYSYPLEEKLVAGTRDLVAIAQKADVTFPAENCFISSDPAGYVDCAVLIFNMAKLRRKFSVQPLIDYLISYPPQWSGQDVFNAIFESEILYLPQGFNVVTTPWGTEETIRKCTCNQFIYDFKHALKVPQILHYYDYSFLAINSPTSWYNEYWTMARKTPYYELLQLRAQIFCRT